MLVQSDPPRSGRSVAGHGPALALVFLVGCSRAVDYLGTALSTHHTSLSEFCKTSPCPNFAERTAALQANLTRMARSRARTCNSGQRDSTCKGEGPTFESCTTWVEPCPGGGHSVWTGQLGAPVEVYGAD